MERRAYNGDGRWNGGGEEERLSSVGGREEGQDLAHLLLERRLHQRVGCSRTTARHMTRTTRTTSGSQLRLLQMWVESRAGTFVQDEHAEVGQARAQRVVLLQVVQ